MKNYWLQTIRRLAAASVVAGTTAFSSAMCYAQIAFDNASDPVYSDGWQAGDNGGFGFGPWDFSGTYNSPVQQAIDDGLKAGGTGSAPFNDIGRSWTLFNPNAPPDDNGTDIARAGRAIPGELQPGQTVSVIIDNPTERRFFRGYTVRFNHGGGSLCYAGDNCSTAAFDPGSVASRLQVGTFEYFTNGQWYATGTGGNPTLFDLDTHHGMQIDLTLETLETFTLKMTPLDNPAIAYMKSGTLEGPAGSAIDWVEFNLYNTDSDFYPGTVVGVPPQATDFDIRSMSIVIPEPGTASLVVVGAGLFASWTQRRVRKRG